MIAKYKKLVDKIIVLCHKDKEAKIEYITDSQILINWWTSNGYEPNNQSVDLNDLESEKKLKEIIQNLNKRIVYYQKDK